LAISTALHQKNLATAHLDSSNTWLSAKNNMEDIQLDLQKPSLVNKNWLKIATFENAGWHVY
jgi:hypothetical protein